MRYYDIRWDPAVIDVIILRESSFKKLVLRKAFDADRVALRNHIQRRIYMG